MSDIKCKNRHDWLWRQVQRLARYGDLVEFSFVAGLYSVCIYRQEPGELGRLGHRGISDNMTAAFLEALRKVEEVK
jgi:hypothetical protein